MKKLILTYFLVFLCFDSCFAESTPNLSKNIKNLDTYIQSQINAQKAIGCAVAVVDNGKVVFIKAYGKLKRGQKDPVNLKTVFQLGSISKPISSALVAILVKEGLLTLNSPVNKIYFGLDHQTTVQHILSHTTGYKRTGWNQKIEAHQSRENLLKQLVDSPQDTPGFSYDYHNLAYSFIEEVIASSLQTSFKNALKTKLFFPLQMHSAVIGDLDFDQQSNYSWPHQQDKKEIMKPCKDYSRAYHRAISSAAGISSTIKDMAIFLQLQMGEWPDILTEKDLLPFHTPIIKAPDAKNWLSKYFKGDLKSYYGLGWRIVDHQKNRLIFHGGWLKGFMNFLGFMPDRKTGVVILHNGESSLSIKAAMIFFDSL